MKKIILIVFVLIFSACKQDKNEIEPITKEKQEEVKNKAKLPRNFTVKLTARVELDDQFRVLYSEGLGEPFNGKRAVFKKIIGSNDYQTIEFVLPKPGIYPARLRLNVGYNKNQKSIDIQSVEILHEGSQFFISDSLFNKYFFPNKYIEYHKETGKAIFKKEDGKHVPFFVSRKPLNDMLIDF